MVHLSLRLISDPPGCGFPGNSCFGDGYSAFNISPTPLCLWVQVFVWEEDQIEENGHIGWTGSNIWTSNVTMFYDLVYDTLHYGMTCFVSWGTTYYVIQGFRMNIYLPCYFVLNCPKYYGQLWSVHYVHLQFCCILFWSFYSREI